MQLLPITNNSFASQPLLICQTQTKCNSDDDYEDLVKAAEGEGSLIVMDRLGLYLVHIHHWREYIINYCSTDIFR